MRKKRWKLDEYNINNRCQSHAYRAIVFDCTLLIWQYKILKQLMCVQLFNPVLFMRGPAHFETILRIHE